MGHNFSFCKTCETPLDCDFCDKLEALIEPGRMTMEELKAEAKRQGYKLIKDENIQVEPCLCGGTRREWWSGPEGHKVVCLRCGLESPWVPRSKGKNGVKKAWNAMISQKDEILWWHIDNLVIDQLGVAFEREEED